MHLMHLKMQERILYLHRVVGLEKQIMWVIVPMTWLDAG